MVGPEEGCAFFLMFGEQTLWKPVKLPSGGGQALWKQGKPASGEPILAILYFFSNPFSAASISIGSIQTVVLD